MGDIRCDKQKFMTIGVAKYSFIFNKLPDYYVYFYQRVYLSIFRQSQVGCLSQLIISASTGGHCDSSPGVVIPIELISTCALTLTGQKLAQGE